MNNKFISCDWGTSSFRLRLVTLSDDLSGNPQQQVTGEWKNDQGIAGTFESWRKTGESEEHRVSFYRSILEGRISELERQLNISLSGLSVVISGMASSSIGMKELPYKELPFGIDGEDIYSEILTATEKYPHEILLLSGAKTADDVMRGEETQLIGCLSHPGKERIFIFPGTHSKHVRVKDGKAIDFSTYMTGEYFALLSKHSILAVSLAEASGSVGSNAFREGVKDSVRTNILHQSFLIRTHQLFGKRTREENYHYLSGLLIGTECKELINTDVPLTIVSEGGLKEHYDIALQTLDIKGVDIQGLDQAVIRGQAKILALKNKRK